MSSAVHYTKAVQSVGAMRGKGGAHPPWRTRASLTGRKADTDERRLILPLIKCVCAELKRDSAANQRARNAQNTQRMARASYRAAATSAAFISTTMLMRNRCISIIRTTRNDSACNRVQTMRYSLQNSSFASMFRQHKHLRSVTAGKRVPVLRVEPHCKTVTLS
jgi:hypothetical protein